MRTYEDAMATLFGRDSLTQLNPLMRETYEVLVRDVWSLYDQAAADHLGPPPELLVIYSPHSYPHILRFGSQDVLVYDQHLGQYLNMLSRLVLSDGSATQVKRYLQKLYASRYFIKGMFEASATMATEYIWGVRNAGAEESDAKTGALKERHVLLQEMFVMAHELAHVAMRRSAALRDYAEHYVDMAHEFDELFTLRSGERKIRKRMRKDLLAARRRIWPEASGPVPHVGRVSGGPYLGDRVAMDSLTSSASLRLEYMCDCLATEAVCNLNSEGAGPAGVVGAVEACSAALLAVRLLRGVDDKVEGRVSEKAALIAEESIARMTLFRRFTSVLAYGLVADEDLGFCNQVRAAVTHWNREFARVVGDHELFFFEPELELSRYSEGRGQRAAAQFLSKRATAIPGLLGFTPMFMSDSNEEYAECMNQIHARIFGSLDLTESRLFDSIPHGLALKIGRELLEHRSRDWVPEELLLHLAREGEFMPEAVQHALVAALELEPDPVGGVDSLLLRALAVSLREEAGGDEI